MKACRNCLLERPLKDFYVHPRMADGHLNICKPCVIVRVRKHRQANIDRIRAYDRKRATDPHRIAARVSYYERMKNEPENKKRRRQQNREWRDRNRLARTCHIAVNNALRDGKIIRGDRCEKCGTSKPEAHHEDYEAPFDITWLCRPCHLVRHKELRWG